MSPEIFVDVFDLLERYQVRYVVVSGAAVVLHGFERPIADLDIVIDPAPNEADRAMQVLFAAGFVPSVPLPLSMVTVLRMFDAEQREIDLFVRYRISFEDLWPGSEMIKVGESNARVISLDRLLEAKRLVGRPHDLTDVEGLLALGRD